GRPPGGLPRPALHAPVAVAPHLPGLGSQEGVARPPLPPDERLEQEPEGRPCDLGERGERRVGVEHDLARERHDHAAPLAAGEKLGATVRHAVPRAGTAACGVHEGDANDPSSVRRGRVDLGRRSARRARRAPRAGLERRGGARARPPRDRAAQPGRGGHRAARLQGPGPRVPLFPRTVRRGADRAAAPHQGRPAGAGSVLEGAGTQQATHRRLARPGRAPHRHQLPPRPPGHHPEQLRRRAAWLDMPARGIIRGRWEIDGYALNLGLATSWFAGEEITAVPKAERDSFPWTEPLDAAVQAVAEPVRRGDLERVRAEVQEIAGRRALSGLPPRRLGVRGLSDVVHANRVEGLAVGAGFVWRGGGEARELRSLASYGTSDDRPKGEVTGTERRGRVTLEASVYRAVRDVADQPVIAPVLNSFASQELGDDYGDYYLATGARLAYHRRLGTRGEWSATLSRDAVASLAVATTPATGSFRPNPPLGGPSVDLVRVGVRRQSEGFAVRRDLALEAALEG